MNDSQQLLADAFPTLYPKLYRLVRIRVAHTQDAEEIVSKTVETMVKRIDRFDQDRGTIDAWATGIAKQHILHYWRDRKVTVDLSEAEHLVVTHQHLADEVAIDALLSSLNETQRSLMILRYVDGYSAEELAPRFAMSSAALRQQLHRITRKLALLFTETL
jgi:RNA polymerase sigma-70 factor (ECF subfamily)